MVQENPYLALQMEEEAPQPSGYYMQPIDGGGSIRDSKRYVESPVHSPTSDKNEPPNYEDATNDPNGWVFKLFSQLCMQDRIALNATCLNDINDGCRATGKGSTEKSFIVPGRNRIHDLLSDALISELKGICQHLVLSFGWSGDRIKIINRPRL